MSKCTVCSGLGRECAAGCSAHPSNWTTCDACGGSGLESDSLPRVITADAALWLWQNREAASEAWLEQTSPTNLINVCGYAKKFDCRKLPAPKLHTMVSVMEAYHAVPTEYLAGTSNWCAAMAQELNR